MITPGAVKQNVALVQINGQGGWGPMCATCAHSVRNDGAFRDHGMVLRCLNAERSLSDGEEHPVGFLAGGRELLVKPSFGCVEWQSNGATV